MRIALVTPTFPPLIGGGETYALVLSRELVALGHDVVVMTDGLAGGAPEIEDLSGVTVLRAHRYKQTFLAPENVAWQEASLGLLGEFHSLAERAGVSAGRFDVVHGNSIDAGWIASAIGREHGAAVVCSSNEFEPDARPYGLGRCRSLFSSGAVDCFLAPSRYYADRYRDWGAPENRVRLVYYGVDQVKFAFSSLCESDPDLVVCAARIKPRKDLLTLVEAFGILAVDNPRARLVIAGTTNSGSGEYERTLLDRIRELGLVGRIEIRRDVQFGDMPDLLRQAGVVVQPSLAEGLGGAVIEAMASGRPVVVTDTTGLDEVIRHGVEGLVVPPRNPPELARALKEVLADRGLAAELALRGRSRAESMFDVVGMIQSTVELYEELATVARTAVAGAGNGGWRSLEKG